MSIVPLKPVTPIASVTEQEAVQAAGALSNVPFANVLQDAIDDLQQAQAASRQDAYDLAMGTVDSLEQVMIHSAMTQLALQTTVDLTTRAVASYKEIMQMQI